MDSKRKFAFLELGRGIAALLVVLYHIDDFYFSTTKYWATPFFGGYFAFGKAGVEFFFVLSGFVMTWSHYSDFGKRDHLWLFMKKRIIRIYPLSIFTVLVMYVLYVLNPTSGDASDRNPLNLIQSLLLVGQEPLDAVNFPSWTLWHENLFYLFCGAMILNFRSGFVLLVLWSATCLSLAMTSNSTDIFYALKSLNILFLFGVLSALLAVHYKIRYGGLIMSLGVIVFFGAGWILPHRDRILTDVLIYGAASVAIIFGAVSRREFSSEFFQNVAGWFGRISYPVYLTHMITLAVFAKFVLLLGLQRWLEPIAGATLMFVATIIVAQVTHIFFEKPASAWLRAKYLHKSKAQHSVTV